MKGRTVSVKQHAGGEPRGQVKLLTVAFILLQEADSFGREHW